jgi:hypothetical protein
MPSMPLRRKWDTCAEAIHVRVDDSSLKRLRRTILLQGRLYVFEHTTARQRGV